MLKCETISTARLLIFRLQMLYHRLNKRWIVLSLFAILWWGTVGVESVCGGKEIRMSISWLMSSHHVLACRTKKSAYGEAYWPFWFLQTVFARFFFGEDVFYQNLNKDNTSLWVLGVQAVQTNSSQIGSSEFGPIVCHLSHTTHFKQAGSLAKKI